MHPESQLQPELARAAGAPERGALLALAVLVLATAMLLWHWPTLMEMLHVWRNSVTFAHGFIVLPVFALLVWGQRGALSRCRVQPFAPALALVALCGAAWLLGALGGAAIVQEFALIAMIPALVWAVLGTQVARVLAFPLAFLFFAVPVGQFMVPKLIELTADFTVLALKATGVPVYRQGNHFQIPSGSWSVVEACSGIRYLIASLMGGVLFAHLFYRSFGKRLAFIALSVLVPLLANWVRAYGIVMVGHLSSNRLAVGIDHLIYGWLFFGAVMGAMFLFGMRFVDRMPGPRARPAAAPGGRIWQQPHLGTLAALALGLALLWRPGYALLAWQPAGEAHIPAIAGTQGWREDQQRFADWRPGYAGAAAERAAVYASGDGQVGLYLGYYFDQARNGELITWGNTLTAGTGWSATPGARVQLPLRDATLAVPSVRVSAAGAEPLQVWTWYWIDGRLTGSEHVAKWYLALNRLSGRGDDAAVVAIYAPYREPADAVAARLRSFAAGMWPHIDAALHVARQPDASAQVGQ